MNDSTKEIKLSHYHAAYWFNVFNAGTWTIVLGSPMVLVAQHLGANTLQVGILLSFLFLVLPLQMLSVLLLPKLGYKRQAILFWQLRTVLLLVPMYIAWRLEDGIAEWMLPAFTVTLFVFCFFRAIGTTSLAPWFTLWVPDSIRGKFLSTEQLVIGVCGIVYLSFASCIFRYCSFREAFLITYTFAFIQGILTTLPLSKIPDLPVKGVLSLKSLWVNSGKYLFTPSLFQRNLFFFTVFNLVFFSAAPFLTYYLRSERALSDSYILLLSLLHYSGMICASFLVRSKSDSVGLRAFFYLWLFTSVMSQVLSLTGILTGAPAVFLFAAGSFLNGASSAILAATNTCYLLHVISEEERPMMLNFHSSFLGIVNGLTPIVSGAALRGGGGGVGASAHMDVRLFIMLSVGLIIAHFVAIAYVRSLEVDTGKKNIVGFEIGTAAEALYKPWRSVLTAVSSPESLWRAKKKDVD